MLPPTHLQKTKVNGLLSSAISCSETCHMTVVMPYLEIRALFRSFSMQPIQCFRGPLDNHLTRIGLVCMSACLSKVLSSSENYLYNIRMMQAYDMILFWCWRVLYDVEPVP